MLSKAFKSVAAHEQARVRNAERDLLRDMPPVRGKIEANASLAEQSWFRVGGPAEVLFKPQDLDDLSYFLTHLDDDIPVTYLGVCSNTLIRDGGIRGVVIKLGPAFSQIRVDGTSLTAGSGAVDLNVARSAQAAGVAGLEFLSGIPGTIGGGLRMNAGAYGKEFKDIVAKVEVMDRHGRRKIMRPGDMGWSYRHCAHVPEDHVFLWADLQGEEGDPLVIKKRMQDIQDERKKSQPVYEKTCGSTFANPADDPQKRKSWALIDAAGCRGLRVGGAQVSEKHCNFLINRGAATAADIENLGEEVRKRVRDKFGIDLRWEIRRMGEKS